jgi:hypothetical protein
MLALHSINREKLTALSSKEDANRYEQIRGVSMKRDLSEQIFRFVLGLTILLCVARENRQRSG